MIFSNQKVKVKKVIVISTLSLLIFIIVLFTFKNFINFNITEEEIEETFRVNLDKFQVVAEYLIGQPGVLDCYVENQQIIVVQVDENYNRMNIIIKDKVVQENLAFILIELKYKRISKNENEVNFLLHPAHEVNGFDDGIAFIKSGSTENTPLINQSYTKIMDYWYYFFTGYV